jgi:hypothetical protein
MQHRSRNVILSLRLRLDGCIKTNQQRYTASWDALFLSKLFHLYVYVWFCHCMTKLDISEVNSCVKPILRHWSKVTATIEHFQFWRGRQVGWSWFGCLSAYLPAQAIPEVETREGEGGCKNLD